MTPDEVIEGIKLRFGDAVKSAEVKGMESRIEIHPEKGYEILAALQGMGFEYLNCLSAVDRIATGELEVVYHLSSLSLPTKALVRARVPRDNPIIRSVASLWGTADWHEREAFDMMGIRFDGHPDLRRILLSEDWVGYPLRKDYQDERLVPYEPV